MAAEPVAAVRRYSRRIAAAVCFALAAVVATCASATDSLAARYAAWRPAIGHASGPALSITSVEESSRMRGDIDGVVAARFDVLAERLVSPRDWCDIALMHLNVKTCTYDRAGGGDRVTLYSGSKRFETPESAFALRYAFRVIASRPDYVAVELTARSGPLDTRDYSIVVEAMPIDGQSFVHLSYAYRPSAASRFATSAYLATAGSAKKGFTVVGRDDAGHLSYVAGVRGIVERNAMRNFLAIEAFIDDCDAPASNALKRFANWFDLTERYPEQLHELERGEYLAIKQKEYRQQLALQHSIDAASTSRADAGQ